MECSTNGSSPMNLLRWSSFLIVVVVVVPVVSVELSAWGTRRYNPWGA